MSINIALTNALKQELKFVSEFVEQLNIEQNLLTSKDSSALHIVTEHKNSLIDQLSQCAQNREQLLRSAGFPDSSDGLKAYLAVHGDSALCEIFEALKIQAAEAKRLNALNARLVSLRLQVTQQALSILLPQEQAPALYDVQGQSAQRVGYKLIDSA